MGMGLLWFHPLSNHAILSWGAREVVGSRVVVP